MKAILKKLSKKLGLLIIVITVSALAIVITECLGTNYPILCKVIEKIIDIIAIGVIWGLIVDAGHLIGVFKEDLEEILYGTRFVRKRKDLYPLWENLSKELFKNKFPYIRKELLETIHGYLPKDTVSYYDNYDVTTTLEWQNEDHRIIRETKEVTFDLVTSTDAEIVHRLKTWTKIENRDGYTNNITRVIANGENIELEAGNEVRTPDGHICHEQKLKLQGKKRYKIKYTRVKTYNFDDDYYVAFKAQYIVHNLRVSLFLPEDVSAIFLCRGTQNNFEDLNDARGRIMKQYRGIILPRQGYIFVLKRERIHHPNGEHNNQQNV